MQSVVSAGAMVVPHLRLVGGFGLPKTRGFTLVELLAVVTLFGVLVAVVMPAMVRARESRLRASCQRNLKQLGIVLKMYGGEASQNLFPPVHGDQSFGRAADAIGCDVASFHDRPAFSPRMDVICPAYSTDLNVFVCPVGREFQSENPLGVVGDDGTGQCKHVGEVTHGDASYIYLGYTLDKVGKDAPMVNEPIPAPAQFAIVASHMNKVLFNHDPLDDAVLDQDILLSDIEGANPDAANEGSMILYRDARISRLNERMIRIMLTDVHALDGMSPALVPVMWDRTTVPRAGEPTSSHRGGCNTLYQDGHVEFTRTGESFPLIPGMRLFDDREDTRAR